MERGRSWATKCQAAFAVESTDLDDVQALLVDAVTAGANEIEAVDFDVLGKRELRAEARRKAIAAARRSRAVRGSRGRAARRNSPYRRHGPGPARR
jgi:uncharacterized protein YggE